MFDCTSSLIAVKYTVAMTSALAAAVVVKEFCCLIEPWIGCSKLTSEKYYAHTKFCQFHNGDPQLNFIQHPKTNFPELWACSGNLGKFPPRENIRYIIL